MDRELTPEEEREFSQLNKKIRHMLFMTEEEEERCRELATKKYGTSEEIAEEHSQNRKTFLAFQEQLSKKQKNT